mmetsp:Transcript_10825/g.16207  ORF Transcript_10825/g.16207 Transcript_10825/m.16207 type:complete len:205 (+) Transcript_10825:305-919(+)
MFTFIDRTKKKYKIRDMSSFKIVLLGNGGVGKSALTIQMVQNHFVEQYDPTVEDSYRKQVEIDGEIAMLDILDTAGQSDYKAIRESNIREAQGFILVYDITSQSSFSEIAPLREQILRKKDLDSVPMVLFGNKCDLEEKRVITKEQGQQYASKTNIRFIEGSAKTRTNVELAFFDVVRQLRSSSSYGPRPSYGPPGSTKKCLLL